jgi:hypothetical protein
MFTGDLFVGGRERALRVDYDIWGILDSLRVISRFPISYLFPGSARVRQDPQEELTDKINYLQDLGERILDLYQSGKSVRAIVRELCGPPMFVEIFTLGHFSRRGLVKSFLRERTDSSSALPSE